MAKKQTSIRMTPAQEAQINALSEMGYGNVTTIITMAVDRMYQAEYDLSHAPWGHKLLWATEKLRKVFVELARLRAREIEPGFWIDVVTGETFSDKPMYYVRYRHAYIDDSGVENFLKANDLLIEIK